jgi:hypothetical protein
MAKMPFVWSLGGIMVVGMGIFLGCWSEDPEAICGQR